MDVSTYPENPAKPDDSRGELNADDLLAPRNRLNMTRMPVAGMQTTYDAFALQTDSASAGTAFVRGLKTRSGVIGMDDEKKTRATMFGQKMSYEIFEATEWADRNRPESFRNPIGKAPHPNQTGF
jgi:hypothetical protein